MTTKAIANDPRTEAQAKADEEAAAGKWPGFKSEELLTEKGALAILAQQTSAAAPAAGVCNQPFRWRNEVYRILRCEFLHDQAIVEVAPKNDAFAAEIKGRLETDRFHHLAYCQGFGFACFPEDYARYQE